MSKHDLSFPKSIYTRTHALLKKKERRTDWQTCVRTPNKLTQTIFLIRRKERKKRKVAIDRKREE